MDEGKNRNAANIFKLNNVIWYLTASDVFSWGLYIPLNALIGIYLSQIFEVGTVEIIGIGVAIYYVTRSLTQIPIGIMIDKIKRDRDDIAVLVLGSFLLGIPFLFYPLIQNQFAFYLLQMVAGLGASMNLVAWRKLFAKNLDVNKEGTSYAVYDTVLSLSIATFSFIMGLIANVSKAYFDFVVITVGLLIISSVIWPIMIYSVKTRKSKD